MLDKLQRIIKLKGIAWVSAQLGYRSTGAVIAWMRSGAVPRIAEGRLSKFLKEYNHEKK